MAVNETKEGSAAPAAASNALLAILVLLTMTTGLIDAVSYLGLGHVFVANMTGNIVFLGFALAGAKGFSVASSLVALAAFLFGAAVAGRVIVALGPRWRRWLPVATAAQMLLAAAAAIINIASSGGVSGNIRFVLIAVLAVGTGIQNGTVRKLAIPDVTTTVLTLTLTGLASDSSLAGGTNPRLGRRTTAVAAMLVGAVIGAALVIHAGLTATLWVTTAVYAVITVCLLGERRTLPATPPHHAS